MADCDDLPRNGEAVKLPLIVATWPKYWRELYEERAGIREFQGNQPHEMAEREAESEIRSLAWRENT
jgi:hypothetical protein